MSASLCFAVLVLAASCAPADSQWTRAAVRESHSQQCRRIESIEIELQSVHWLRGMQDGDAKSLRQRFAARANFRFSDLSHIQPGLEWSEDPFRTRTILLPGELETYWVTQRVCERSQKDADIASNLKLGDSVYHMYLMSAGWSPPDESAFPIHANAIAALLGRNDISVSNTREAVDGRPCVVVNSENGVWRQSAWIDVDRGSMPVRRYISSQERDLHWVYENSDFREVAPGIWFPFATRHVKHCARDSEVIPKSRSDILVDMSVKLLDMKVNVLSDDLSSCPLLPGTIIREKDTGTETRIAGGLELLDQVVDAARNGLVKRSNSSQSRDWMAIIEICGLPMATWFLLRFFEPSLLRGGAA
jgi:hypothetical protein